MKPFVLILMLIISHASTAQLTDEDFAKEINKSNVIHQLEQVAAGTLKKEQHERFQVVMERLVTLRPQNTNYMFSLAKSYALQDMKTEAYNVLVKLQNAGFSYPIVGNEAFDNVARTKVYDYIQEGMIGNGNAYGMGEPVAQVPEQYAGMLFENMAYDKKGSRFLLGSIRSGEVYTLDKSGSFKTFIKPNTGKNETFGVVDLVTDNERDVLWLATASMPQFNGANQENFGKATLSKYQLSTGKWLANLNTESLNKPMLFNALHITSEGDLYFINPFTREMLTSTSKDEQVKPFMSLTQLTAIKAITSNTPGTVIYVSDYDQGLFLINAETKAVKTLNDPSTAFLSGIDDLFYTNGDLIAIQNKTSPSRIMRILLNNDLFYQAAIPIESNHSLATAMSKGFVSGKDVYYIANSQWGKMDLNGNLINGEKWEPVHLIKANSEFQLEKHLESQKRMADIKKKRGIE